MSLKHLFHHEFGIERLVWNCTLKRLQYQVKGVAHNAMQ